MGFLNSIFFIILSLTFYQSLLHLPIVATKDVLMPGDELDSLHTTSILLSSNGIFTLGFFTLNPSNTNFTYLGVWLTNEENYVTAWVANRDTPIIGGGILTIDDSGTLRVINKNGATLFNVSNDKVGSGNTTRAMLEDSGNFLVYDVASNRTIWQSFDHLTNTLLPGMKLGYNLTTRQNWTLTSWADDNAPASGAFTMRLEQYQNSPQLLIHRRGELYWASGPWDKSTGTFLNLHSMVYVSRNTKYNMIVVSDASGMYFTFQTPLFVSSLQLTIRGQLTDSVQYPYPFTPEFCYGYQSDDVGCVVSAFPYCRVLPSANDRYDFSSTSYSFSGPRKYDDNSSISLGDCMERCWNDCNCSACSTYNNGTGCIYWTENQVSGDHQEYRLVYYLDSYEYPYRKFRSWILLSLLIVPVFVLAYVRIKRRIIKGKENRKRDDFILQLTGSNSFNYGDELERGIRDAPDVKIFSLKAILAATNNFSDENKLGQGGYGPVYKGELSDG